MAAKTKIEWSDLPFPRLGDDPRQREAVQWLLDEYGGPTLVRGLCAIVRSSSFALDYLRQAPVIGACDPKRIATEFNRGGRLKEVLARLGLAYPLRRLSANACGSRYAPLFKALSVLNPSLLSQAIPGQAHRHREWVQQLDAWQSTMIRRGCHSHFHLEWATVNATRSLTGGRALSDIADLAAALGAGFNPAWTIDRAATAAAEWHVELAKTRGAEGLYRRLGVRFEEPIDYGDLPLTSEVGRYTIVALRSGADLHADGRMMRHCVASYGADVVKGNCRIFSIRQGQTPIATMELKPSQAGWRIVQIKGPFNARPDEQVLNAAHLFVAALAKPGRASPRRRAQHNGMPEVRHVA